MDEPRATANRLASLPSALANFLEPGTARPLSVGAAGSLGCAWVIKASPRAASEALPAEHLHLSCGVRAAHQRPRLEGRCTSNQLVRG